MHNIAFQILKASNTGFKWSPVFGNSEYIRMRSSVFDIN